LVDGEWVPLDLPPGNTARVEITHFSKNLITAIPAAVEYLRERN